MPYFIWKGVTNNGAYCSGKTLSQSLTDLTHLLARDNITLAQATIYRSYYSGKQKLTIRSNIISHLSVLLDAGVRLAPALEIVASLMPTKKSSNLVEDLQFCIESGIPLSEALGYYPDFFDPLTRTMIEVGESSGALALVFSSIAEHDKELALFDKNIKDAIRTPAITFSFFLIITLIIFIKIIPYFVFIIESSGKELPTLTRFFLSISVAVRSGYFWLGISILFLFWFAVRAFAQNFIQALKETIIVNLPFVRGPLLDWTLGIFLNALHTLLSQGVPLITALHLAKETVPYHHMRWYIDQWTAFLDEGKSFHQTIALCSWRPLVELSAFIKIGEESGMLTTMVDKAAVLYKKKAQKEITVLVTLLQPLLLLVLGCLIGVLIFALYIPLLSLGDSF